MTSQQPEQRPDIIVIETGGLALGSLGAYGCGAAETPSFDRLASCSALFDSHYATSTERADIEAAHLASDSSGDGVPLAARLAAAGYETVRLLQGYPEGGRDFGFGQTIALPAPADRIADSIEETAFYTFFLAVSDILSNRSATEEPLFLWASTAGFEGVWDFPPEQRALFVEDEEDPEPYAGTAPPSITFPFIRDRRGDELPPDYDRLCSVIESYNAGLSLWDQGLELFLGVLAGSPRRDSCLVLTSSRAFPLGEHGRIGPAPKNQPLFYSEEFHLPLLISFPDKPAAALRTNELTTPADLRDSIAALGTGGTVPLRDLLAGGEARRQYILQKSGACRGVVTKDWLLRAERTADGEIRRELYVLPDDRRQINDIARRCPDDLARLWSLLTEKSPL